MKISWINLPDLIKYELKQRGEEGSDVSALLKEWGEIEQCSTDEKDLGKKAADFFARLNNLPEDIKNIKNEPGIWADIEKLCGIKTDPVPEFSAELVNDRILGGWLGRSAGCLLGKPVEKTPRAGIKELLTSNNTWPLSDYVSGIGIPEELLKKYPWNRHDGRESLKENIRYMNEDDDMNYPMINLDAYERYGEAFTPQNILQNWHEFLPVLSTFTAERVAYFNGLKGINPPGTATEGNPYREWIGAQIRADLWGWVSPGQPLRAAELAWRDASLSHVRNGIYGEIYIAAIIALSFRLNNITDIIKNAIEYIPPESRLAEALRFVIALPLETQPWEETLDILYDKFGAYHWVHTINNAALVTASLIASGGSYEKAVCNVVMGGWDTDSNGATVGSVMGTLIGAEKLPEKWIAPLKDTIRSGIKGFDNSRLSMLAERTAKLANYIKR
jgi:ADP-ribosylglycohydrolase